MTKYLFNGKIQIFTSNQNNWGITSPQKDTGEPDTYKYCLCLGNFYICWG